MNTRQHFNAYRHFQRVGRRFAAYLREKLKLFLRETETQLTMSAGHTQLMRISTEKA